MIIFSVLFVCKIITPKVHANINVLHYDIYLDITDLNSKIIGRGKKATYALILEADIPKRSSCAARLKRNFQGLEKKLRVKIAFKPADTAYL